jgi:opacity protein-like surface antigen
MNKFLALGIALFALPGLASAADMPLPAPVPLAGWGGCYVGGHFGGASSHFSDQLSFDDVNTPGGARPEFIFTDSFNTHGFAGGGQGGCNWQRGIVVFGFEGDWTSANQSQSAFFSEGAGGDNAARSAKLDYLWSFRGRAGVTFWDNFLLYGTLGIGGANFKYSFGLVDTDSGNSAATLTNKPAGPVFGVGGEWKMWGSNFILGVDYLHYATGQDFLLPPSTVVGGPGPTTGDRVNMHDVDVIRGRLSYLFNWNW